MMKDNLFEITKDRVKKFEGFSPVAYKDNKGVITIGYGRNIDNRGITKDEADSLLTNDLANSYNEAVDIFGFDFFNGLTTNIQSVIIEMVFNLGKTRFLEFKKTIAYIKNNDFKSASKEMLNSRWANDVGVRAYELSKLMRDGI